MVPAVHLHERGDGAAVAVLELAVLQGQERQAADPDQLCQQLVSRVEWRLHGPEVGIRHAVSVAC